MPRRELLDGLGLLGRLILDILRLINHNVLPLNGFEMFFITQSQCIGRNYNIMFSGFLCKCLVGQPLRPIVDHDIERGAKAL